MRELYFSNSELAALATKATRGAGFPWGIAQEAGMAVKNLSAHGLPSAEVLLSYIEGERGRPPAFKKNSLLGKNLCPLTLGTAICDFAKQLEFPLHFNVRYPLLLLPFLLQTTKILHCGFLVIWKQTEIRIESNIGMYASGLLSLKQSEVVIEKTNASETTQANLKMGQNIEHSICNRLEKLALKTMVPISATSRTGAGAAGSDND